MCKLLKAVSRLTLALTGHFVHAKPAVVLLQHQCVLVGANDFYNDLRAQCPNACGASMPDSSISLQLSCSSGMPVQMDPRFLPERPYWWRNMC